MHSSCKYFIILQEFKSSRLKLSFEEIENGSIFNQDENLSRLITENFKLKHRLSIIKRVKYIICASFVPLVLYFLILSQQCLGY